MRTLTCFVLETLLSHVGIVLWEIQVGFPGKDNFDSFVIPIPPTDVRVCVCVCVCAQGLCVYLWDLYMCVQDPLCVCVCVVCVCVCIHSQPDHYSLWSVVCRHV